MAEALAFGTLLLSGTPVRFTGQDTRRGTIQSTPCPRWWTRGTELNTCAGTSRARQPRCESTTPRFRAGVLGFEYGYSRDYPEALVLWRRNSVILPTARR